VEPDPPLHWVDSHCHLQDEADPLPALARARAAGVTLVVCVGTDVASSRRALELAGTVSGPQPASVSSLPAVLATAGLHPHEASRRGVEGVDGIARLVTDGLEENGLQENGLQATSLQATSRRPGGSGRATRFAAVGECGLDYHYDHSPRAAQRVAFAAQIELALRRRLPLVIHSREAWDDTLAILGEAGVPPITIFHCFTGGPDEARRCLELGAYLSFAGIVTFKCAGPVRAAAAMCPSDRLLVETDAPLLTPVPHRGRPNEPALLPLVGMAVAEARAQPAGVVANASSGAAARAFGALGPFPAPGRGSSGLP
jgi:TatD DNase family protein